MALFTRSTVLVVFFAAAGVLHAANSISLPSLEIGGSLQTSAKLTFREPAPEAGYEVMVTSEDPNRIRLAKTPEQPGETSIILKIRPGLHESVEFWVQAIDDKGTVRYTASEPSLGEFSGAIQLYPSAITIAGPHYSPSFTAIRGAHPTQLSVQSVRLDASGKIAEPQYVAGGKTATVQVRSSNPEVGQVGPPDVEIGSASAVAVVLFQAVQEGTTQITISCPDGFTNLSQYTRVDATVSLPGIMVADIDTTIGENLQVPTNIGLGAVAPEGGVTVRVTSSDPSRLLISKSAVEAGAGQIELFVPAGQVHAPVIYLQSLASSGKVVCTASASGFKSRAVEIPLSPSGIVLMYAPYGPPDEAEVLRPMHNTPSPTTTLYMHLSKTKKIPLHVWTVRLDPVTLRGADITAQPLRGGYTLQVDLQNSNPDLGVLTSSVKIPPAAPGGVAEFVPKAAGKSVLSVVTPSGFTQPANSTTVTTIIYP